MATEAPLLANEADHPQEVVATHGDRRIVVMDSARYVDARNRGSDVVVPASYLGVLPARLMVPHRPRAVIGHDGAVGMDGAGIAGLWYLEALGIPAATASAASAELGNGMDQYTCGVISRLNIYAERCGVAEGMPVAEAARLLPGGSRSACLCPRRPWRSWRTRTEPVPQAPDRTGRPLTGEFWAGVDRGELLRPVCEHCERSFFTPQVAGAPGQRHEPLMSATS